VRVPVTGYWCPMALERHTRLGNVRHGLIEKKAASERSSLSDGGGEKLDSGWLRTVQSMWWAREARGVSVNLHGGSVMDGEQQGGLSPASSQATLAMAKFPHWRRKEKDRWRQGMNGGGGGGGGARGGQP
jgi:hypothetical protein